MPLCSRNGPQRAAECRAQYPLLEQPAYRPEQGGLSGDRLETAAYNRYRTGELHYTTYPLEQYKQLKSKSPEELVSVPTLASYYYVFNTQRKPFDDPKVRKALSLAIDRETITDKILGQGQIAAYSFTPPLWTVLN